MNEAYLSRGIVAAGEDTTGEILSLAARYAAEGVHIVRMDMGMPDIDCPQAAKEAAFEALRSGESHYTDVNGIPRLRKAIAAKERRDKGLDVNEDDVVVTLGASEALLSIFSCFLSEGDEMIVPTPAYDSYMFVLRTMGVKVVQLPIVKDGSIDLSTDEFEKRVTDRTKMILLNYPQNPTGFMYTAEQLRQIADLAKKHDLLVISDECYEKYIFDGSFTSISTLPGMRERTFVVNSVSKSFGMTGWRVGYVMPPRWAVKHIIDFHGNMILCATSFAQFGAAAAYENETEEQMTALREMYRKRRDLLLGALDEIPQLTYVRPGGAFYVFVNVERTGLSGFEFAKRFLTEYHVTCMPGENYGEGYENYVRFAYTSAYEEIEKAAERLKDFVKKLEAER